MDGVRFVENLSKSIERDRKVFIVDCINARCDMDRIKNGKIEYPETVINYWRNRLEDKYIISKAI